MESTNLARFFPGLGTALPPPSASVSPNPVPPRVESPAANSVIHDFSSSPVMVIEENKAIECLKRKDIAKMANPKPPGSKGTCFLATNDLFVYGLKNSVRVLHQDTGAKALLKGHEGPIVDMAIRDSCLVTCSEDGFCIVWEIQVNQPTDDSSINPLVCSESMRIRIPSGDGVQRVLFRTDSAALTLFILHGSTISGVRLDKQLWDVYSSLSNPLEGLQLDKVATFRLTRGHTQAVNDMSFSPDGRICTAGDDGFLSLWIVNDNMGPEIVPIQRLQLNSPITFASFLANSIVCGFANNEEMIMISSTQPYREISKIRFVRAQGGAPIYLRAQSTLDGSYIVLCDVNSPLAILLQVDVTGFRRAVCLQVDIPIVEFSLTEITNDAVEINAIATTVIQTLSLPSLQSILPRAPAQRPRTPLPIPPQQQFNQSSSFMGAPFQPPAVSMDYPPAPTPKQQQQVLYAQQATPQQGNSTGQAMDASVMDAMLQAKMDQMFARFEASQAAKDAKEIERIHRLLDTITTCIAQTVPTMVDKVITEKFQSPEFTETLLSAVKLGVEGSNGSSKGQLDKSLKSLAPGIAEKVSESLQAKLQQPISRAFEDAFRSRLVPAFEAGCRDMMSQFETAFTKRSPVTNQAGAPDVNNSQNFYELVDTAIEQNDFTQAIIFALNSGDANLITSTCERIELGKLLQSPQPHNFPQDVLIKLLASLAADVTSAPLKRLDWIEQVAVAIDPTSSEASKQLTAVATEAKDALTNESQLFSSLGQAASRFRTVVLILQSLGR